MRSAIRKRFLQLAAAAALLLALVCSTAAQETGRCKAQQVKFKRDESSVVLRGKLEPCKRRVYKLRARRGQKMSVLLLPEENDVAFWVLGTESTGGKAALVLEGIHRNGMTDWSGELPFSGEYEIHVARPPVSDSSAKHTLPYRIELRIE
ncbi:MAG TPA: hypothetical protein VM934_14615 [Pyrinomonadaceae bacterium]|nr:hypothetical protein [Pyrinomonadaceae bacterium]